MAESRRVQHCRWAQPTLFVAGPLWAAAEEYPWSCDADGEPRLIQDTAACRACGRWAPNPAKKTNSPGAWREWPGAPK